MDYPISVPSVGLVGGKFVDEDTASGTVGSLIPSAWGNAVTDELLGVIRAAGLAPSEADLTQLVKAIRTLVTAPVGSVRNGRMTVAVAAATATYTADEITVATALGGQSYRLPNFNKSVNLAVVGPGGMDIGSAPASGFIAIYAIYNPTAKVAALLATNAAAKVPELYSAGNMPAGYTASCLLTVIGTASNAQLNICTVRDRTVHISSSYVYSTQSVVIGVLVAPSTIPPNAVSVSGTLDCTCTAASQLGMLALDGETGTGLNSLIGYVTASGSIVCPFFDVTLDSSKRFTVQTSIVGSGTATFRVATSGYKI